MKEKIEFQPLIFSNTNLKQVIELINTNLDPNYSIEFFRWKHIENPFGRSYGLVATDRGKIIGLRMFMFWRFFNKIENKSLTAIRPVDTVVDSNYRGKGLFKKLTLKGIEDCKGKYDLIFNTPNENSLPGYLKMGWSKIPANYFCLGLYHFLPFDSKISGLKQFSLNKGLNSNGWETQKSESFLQWRYRDSKKYKAVSLGTANIIYSVGKLGPLNQIVIHELYGEVNDMRHIVREVCRKHVTLLVYCYLNKQQKKLKPLFLRPRKQAIIIQKEDTNLISNHINFSLGDLEGKL